MKYFLRYCTQITIFVSVLYSRMHLRKHIHLYLFGCLFLNFNYGFTQSDTVIIDGSSYIKKDTKPKMDKHKFNTLFTEGNLMMMENFNDTALKTFLILHEMDPGNANVNFKIG